jgi:hypothetical protein
MSRNINGPSCRSGILIPSIRFVEKIDVICQRMIHLIKESSINNKKCER